MIGNKINIILIIQILPLVYAQLAPAMTHIAPEMGQYGPCQFIQFICIYVKINVDYHLCMSRNKNNNKNFHKDIHSFCIYELYEHNKQLKKVSQLASLSPTRYLMKANCINMVSCINATEKTTSSFEYNS